MINTDLIKTSAEDFLWAGGIEDTFVPQTRPGHRALDDRCDAILHLGNANANVTAKAGYPSVAVPGGFNALSTLTPADPLLERTATAASVCRLFSAS